MTTAIAQNRSKFLRPNEYEGRLDWQQHPDSETPSEVFADMFIAKAYDAWNMDPGNANHVSAVQNWMDIWLP